jgi:hypothetical protein
MSFYRKIILLLCLAFSSNVLAEFKLYDVDPSYREEVYGALLRAMVNTGMASSIELLPTGQILIDAVPETHQQVAAVLEEIRRHEAEPTPRVRLQYWVVLGTPEVPGDANTPAALEGVLDEIREVHGPLSFQLLGNATLVTDSGMGGTSSGELVIRQTAYVQGARLHAELSISFQYKVTVGVTQMGGQGQPTVPMTQMRNQGLELNTSLEQGEFVVVGENSVTDNLFGEGEVDGTFFYIVHWPAAD